MSRELDLCIKTLLSDDVSIHVVILMMLLLPRVWSSLLHHIAANYLFVLVVELLTLLLLHLLCQQDGLLRGRWLCLQVLSGLVLAHSLCWSLYTVDLFDLSDLLIH